MTEKALVSELTWRTLERQREEMLGLPVFVVPDDLPQLFRPTTRKEPDCFHVASLGILADNEKDFRDFLAKAKKRKAELFSREDSKLYVVNGNCETLVRLWRVARRNGAAKIGANISADRKKAATKEAVAKIADRWPMSSDEWPTKLLLAEADISLNTAKAHLGKRPIAQYNYQAKLKRKANAKR